MWRNPGDDEEMPNKCKIRWSYPSKLKNPESSEGTIFDFYWSSEYLVTQHLKFGFYWTFGIFFERKWPGKRPYFISTPFSECSEKFDYKLAFGNRSCPSVWLKSMAYFLNDWSLVISSIWCSVLYWTKQSVFNFC